jgi:hypothetical protein
VPGKYLSLQTNVWNAAFRSAPSMKNRGTSARKSSWSPPAPQHVGAQRAVPAQDRFISDGSASQKLLRNRLNSLALQTVIWRTLEAGGGYGMFAASRSFPLFDVCQQCAKAARWPSRSCCRRHPCPAVASVGSRLYFCFFGLGRHDGFFGRFGYSELDSLLRRDLDSLARRGVPPHPRFPVNTDESSNSRQHEYAVLFYLCDGGLRKVLQERLCDVSRHLDLL